MDADVLFKVSKFTNTNALGNAIARELKLNKKVRMRAIGIHAINQTNKGIAKAGSILGYQGDAINVRIGFDNVKVEEEKELTALNYVCFIADTYK